VRLTRIVFAVIAAGLLAVSSAEASGGRAIARGAARSAARAAARSRAAILRLDLKRHGPVFRLPRSKTVFRNESLKQARVDARRGIPAHRHFTTAATPGRPLSSAATKAKYGLFRAPHARVKVSLPKGARIRHGRVAGGSDGRVRELYSETRLPPQSTQKIVKLRPRPR